MPAGIIVTRSLLIVPVFDDVDVGTRADSSSFGLTVLV